MIQYGLYIAFMLDDLGKLIMNRKKFHLLVLIGTLFLLLSCISCSIQDNYSVTWLDCDGSIIDSKKATYGYDPTKRDLPEDTELWHYTGWITYHKENSIVCTAKKEKKQHLIWKDADGTILNEVYIVKNTSFPSFDLPQSNDTWIYEGWEQQNESDSIVFSAVKKLNSEYFLGNVFQIVVKDADGAPISTGSGFVINDEGWFITNNHVLKDASSAIAFFDIPDKKNGSRYTALDIIGGIYNSSEKDVFIGKLSGYEAIKTYYKDISFTTNYTVGEIAYTIGYPNSSTRMEINSGTILEEYSSIYDKINDIYYVLSDSYIAPGSSGGILINEQLEVIGITTIGLYADENKQTYEAGGSIPSISFLNRLENLDEKEIRDLENIYNKGDSQHET